MGIELRGVWFMYPGRRRWALRDVRIGIREGEILLLVGPNGSGKTTLLKVASGLYRPARGRVIYWNQDIWGVDGARRLELRRKAIYVHEKPVLLRGTVAENIAYTLVLRGDSKDRALTKARELLEDIGSGYLSERKREELSAGEAQLISILRAVIAEPKILLLDEPTAHLDLRKRKTFIHLIGKIKEENGTGIVIATHDYLLARELADRAASLEEGSIKALGDLEDVLEP